MQAATSKVASQRTKYNLKGHGSWKQKLRLWLHSSSAHKLSFKSQTEIRALMPNPRFSLKCNTAYSNSIDHLSKKEAQCSEV